MRSPVAQSSPQASVWAYPDRPDSRTFRFRPEWAHLLYQKHNSPDLTFEFRLHWTVGTGAAVTDLATGWARKANQTGFTLVPIPGDPFALPITANSDPVRGPIFVEMTLCSASFQQDFAFREAIARK